MIETMDSPIMNTAAAPALFLEFDQYFNAAATGDSAKVEVFDGGGAIIAECNEFSEDLKPGHWEAMITECPIVDEFKDKEITEVTFKIKKAFYDKSIIKPYNK